MDAWRPRQVGNPIVAPFCAEPFAEDVRRRFGSFIAEQINPGTRERDLDCTPLPIGALEEAARLGLMSRLPLSGPAGPSGSWVEWGWLLHELGFLCEDLGLPVLLALCATTGNMLSQLGREDLMARYVRPLQEGRAFIAFAWSEGADPFAFRTIVRPDGSDLVLEGGKRPITGAMLATAFMVFARHAETGDIVTVMVDRTDPGVEVSPVSMMGLRSAGFGHVRFQSVRVPRERVIVAHDGLSYGQGCLNLGRLQLPCFTLGRMRAFFEACARDVRQRIRYGLPVAEMQAVQAALGRMAVSLETTRLLVLHALERAGRDEHEACWEPSTVMSKYFTVEQALVLCREAQRVLGGEAVACDSPFERDMRSFQCFVANQGTQLVLEVDMGALAATEVAQSER
jgi:alkylation response protein AidB-like acyl-CoA dehydrogenase